MTGSIILDVVIGLFFIYLLLSLMCSALQELLASLMGLRSKNLQKGINNLLADPAISDIADRVCAHPLIRKLAKEGKKPSYIPARTFTLALMETIKDPASVDGAFSEAKKSVEKLPEGDLKKILTALVLDAGGSTDKVRTNLEEWFDGSMDRVSGWYKRQAKVLMFAIAFGLAAAVNIDSIHVASKLAKDQNLREAVVAQAQAHYVANQSVDPSGFNKDYKKNMDDLKNLKLPIGWNQESSEADEKQCSWPFTIFGWLITALCVSLGAPFWFDALGKALNIRASGRKPDKSTAIK